MDEISPHTILDLIATTKQLSPLLPGTITGKAAMVDSKVWALLQKSITEPIELDRTIDSANIIAHLSFPCVVSLLETFYRSKGELVYNLTPALPNFRYSL